MSNPNMARTFVQMVRADMILLRAGLAKEMPERMGTLIDKLGVWEEGLGSALDHLPKEDFTAP